MSPTVQPSSLGLRAIELLEGLAPEKLDALARQCAWRNYDAGRRIISRNAADRVLFMDHGVVVEEGPPQAIFEAPTQERTRAFISQIQKH